MVNKKSDVKYGRDRQVAGAPGSNQEIRRLVAPSVRWIAAQHRVLLRHALGADADRILAKLETDTAGLEATVANRVAASLTGLLHREVRRVFDDALQGIEGGSRFAASFVWDIVDKEANGDGEDAGPELQSPEGGYRLDADCVRLGEWDGEENTGQKTDRGLFGDGKGGRQ